MGKLLGFIAFPTFSLLSASFSDEDVISQLPVLAACCPASPAFVVSSFGTTIQNKLSSISRFWSMVFSHSNRKVTNVKSHFHSLMATLDISY